MNEILREKLAKVYALVNRGATEGERIAAKKALDRLIDKHGVNESELQSIELKEYHFTYTSNNELTLLIQIVKTFEKAAFPRLTRGSKKAYADLTHLEFITIDSAYEYFRRHMKKEWNRLYAGELKKCRNQKTKAKRRKVLQDLFISRYIILSKLHEEKDIEVIKNNSSKEMKDRMLLLDMEGGQFNRQLTQGLLLNN